MIHPLYIFTIPFCEIRKKEIDLLLWEISRWSFKNSTDKSLSLLKVYREIGWIVKVHWNAARVPRKCSQGSRVDSRAYRYILQLMANGKSISHRDSSYEFHGQRYNSLGSNAIEQDHGYEPIKSYVLTDRTYVKRVFSRCVMLCDAFCNRFAYKEVKKKTKKRNEIPLRKKTRMIPIKLVNKMIFLEESLFFSKKRI